MRTDGGQFILYPKFSRLNIVVSFFLSRKFLFVMVAPSTPKALVSKVILDCHRKDSQRSPDQGDG